ncbi:homologous recombination OB-fold protein isoform X1 [Carcharodon carcharias]|uniref:homologous recombination OB-fold protein isoform X1 n=1 Tax=Carcharodon carcharias TaxID=13397 RepID=UPI001B7DBD98|nr:homologous recombination OB-fold protein isoform X1 [Carcharodon carcharias]
MACSFQKLFSVGEEFDDDDLLSAVLDVESTTTNSSGTNPCVRLRPIASVLRTPARSCYEPRSFPRGTLGQRYYQSEYGSTSKNVLIDDDPTKKTLPASIDASLKSLTWLNDPSNEQNSTPDFKFISNVQQKNSTEVGSCEEIDDLFWSDCKEWNEAANVQNSETKRPTFCENRVLTPGVVPSPINPRADHAKIPAKLPKHEKADDGKGENSKMAIACKNSQATIGIKDASKTFKFINHPSSGFNQCPRALSNSNVGGVAKRETKNSCQIIESHGYSAALLTAAPSTGSCSPIPSNIIRSGKELLTPVPQNHLGKNMLGNTLNPGKLVSPDLQSQSAHQQISSTALRNCPNPMLLRPRTPLQNSSTPRHNGDIKRPNMSTIEPRALMCAIESPSAAVGAMYSPAANSGCVGRPVTNHLIQLVSAANRTPEAVRLDRPRPKRRFPGPAGILPQQHLGKNLDNVFISAPQTPTHGAVPKLQSQEVPSSQQSEDDFGRGPWAAMKAELRLDEEDADCFLRSYSIVMVLRKAALKQLPKGKVPSMAVLLKSLTRTNTDASAVFKDPSGKMQGTIHRQLLVEQPNNLKVGTVLLLKQVGVFSPSLRNHYLNITPSNVIKIYPQDASECIHNQLVQSPQNHIEVQQSPFDLLVKSPSEPRCDSLITNRNSCTGTTSWDSQALPSSTRKESAEISLHPDAALQERCDEDWEADGLDCLMAELPEEFFTTL